MILALGGASVASSCAATRGFSEGLMRDLGQAPHERVRLAQVIVEESRIIRIDVGLRPFRPHVTVARVRRGPRPSRDLPDPPRATFAGEAVTLFRSHLGRGPARYEALERVELTSQ